MDSKGSFCQFVEGDSPDTAVIPWRFDHSAGVSLSGHLEGGASAMTVSEAAIRPPQ